MGRAATIDKPTQINIRIGSELKKNGEAAFAAAGVTSSEAVRKLFEVAESHSADPEFLTNFLNSAQGNTQAQPSEQEHLASLLRQALVIAEKGAA